MNIDINHVREIKPGFGPIFWDTRIHLQHLIPEMLGEWSDERIFEAYPTLKPHHVKLFRQYFRENREEVLAMDKELTAATEERVREFKKRFPDKDETIEEIKARLTANMELRKAERNADHRSAG